MSNALTSVLNHGMNVLTDDTPALVYLSQRGYTRILMQKAEGVFLTAISPHALVLTLLAARPERLRLLAQYAPSHITPALAAMPRETLAALAQGVKICDV